MNFQAKCMTALKKIQNSGSTILFVSHDISSVKSLCSGAIYLEKGKLMMEGKASDVAEHYTQIMREELNAHLISDATISETIKDSSTTINLSLSVDNSTIEFKHSEKFENDNKFSRYGNGIAKVTCVELLDEYETPLISVDFGQKVKIRIYFILNSECEVYPIYYILDDKKNIILGASPRTCGISPLRGKQGDRFIVTYESCLPLQEGQYSIEIQINRSVVLNSVAEFLDVVPDSIVFSVNRNQNIKYWSKVYIENKCTVISA
jgi:lipopolysaccharide transport system ATP-binding protein